MVRKLDYQIYPTELNYYKQIKVIIFKLTDIMSYFLKKSTIFFILISGIIYIAPILAFSMNKAGSGAEKRDQMHHRVYRKPEFPGSFEGADSKDRRVSPIQGMNVNRLPSGQIVSSSTTTSSSSSSDIWITTSDRTVTKSPRNAKSSGASTPMEDAVIGSLKTLIEPPKDGTLSRPGSAPTRGEDSLTSNIVLDPHQRSLSLPKSFLAHNTADG